MTATEFRGCTRKELAQLAKRDRIPGWHGMKKEELVQALLVRERRRRSRSRRQALNGSTTAADPLSRRPSAAGRRNGRRATGNGKPTLHSGRKVKTSQGCVGRRDLSALGAAANGHATDQFEARSDDPFWIHASWLFTRAAIARAEAALGIDWHDAVPVIRLFDTTVGDDEQRSGRKWVRDVEIHGDVDHWYIPVDYPPRTFKLQIGYRTSSGKFFTLASSRAVRMPRPGSNGTVDHRWKQGTKRAEPPQRSANGRNGAPHGRSSRQFLYTDGCREVGEEDFEFQVDAELIVHGTTHPKAELTLLGEPVKLTRDGRFSLRFGLPNGRQVIPAVTVTPSGAQKRTIVLAIERNTRELDPQPTDEFAP